MIIIPEGEVLPKGRTSVSEVWGRKLRMREEVFFSGSTHLESRSSQGSISSERKGFRYTYRFDFQQKV
jgi:hypothetical protein